MSSSFIYVIASNELGPTKIGVSVNPAKRIKQLQTGHEGTLRLFYVEEFDSKEIYKIERIIHRTLALQRLRGEWFSISVEKAILEVKFALIRHADDGPIETDGIIWN